MNAYSSGPDRIDYLPISSSSASPISRSTDTFKYDQDQSCVDHTVHYLSPATTVRTCTEVEGDFYRDFFPIRDHLIDQQYGPSTPSTVSCITASLQRTIAIIKPEYMEFKDVVLRAINDAGLKIVNQRVVHLTPEQVAEIYAKYYGNPVFPHMVVSMSVGPVLVLSLAGLNAVEKWKDMVGPYKILREEWFFPYSVRTRFGIRGDIPEALHASENYMESLEENRYLFPKPILEPLTEEPEKVADFLNLYINPTLLNGLAEVVRNKPIDPVLYLAEWLLLNNPFQPKYPYQIATTST